MKSKTLRNESMFLAYTSENTAENKIKLYKNCFII